MDQVTVDTQWQVLLEFHTTVFENNSSTHWHKSVVVPTQTNCVGMDLLNAALETYLDSLDVEADESIRLNFFNSADNLTQIIQLDLDSVDRWLEKHLVKFEITDVKYK